MAVDGWMLLNVLVRDGLYVTYAAEQVRVASIESIAPKCAPREGGGWDQGAQVRLASGRVLVVRESVDYIKSNMGR